MRLLLCLGTALLFNSCASPTAILDSQKELPNRAALASAWVAEVPETIENKVAQWQTCFEVLDEELAEAQEKETVILKRLTRATDKAMRLQMEIASREKRIALVEAGDDVEDKARNPKRQERLEKRRGEHLEALAFVEKVRADLKAQSEVCDALRLRHAAAKHELREAAAARDLLIPRD
jgi:chromosome segregation ATPase